MKEASSCDEPPLLDNQTESLDILVLNIPDLTEEQIQEEVVPPEDEPPLIHEEEIPDFTEEEIQEEVVQPPVIHEEIPDFTEEQMQEEVVPPEDEAPVIHEEIPRSDEKIKEIAPQDEPEASTAKAVDDIELTDILDEISLEPIEEEIESNEENEVVLEEVLDKWRTTIPSICYTILLVILGMFVGSLGPALPLFEHNTDSEEKQMGWLFAFRGCGYAASGLAGGYILDTYHRKGHFILACACTTLSILVVVSTWLTELPFLLALFTIIGACMGLLDVAGNTFTVWIWKEKVGPWMQLIHLGFGVGAVLIGVVFGVFAYFVGELEGIKIGFYVLASCCVVIAVVILLIPSPNVSAGKKETRTASEMELDNMEKLEEGSKEPEMEKARTNASRQFIGFCGLFLLLYVGSEVGYAGWIYSYAIDMGWAKPSQGDFLSSVFWGAISIGRICAIPLSTRVTTSVMLIMDILGCIISMVWLFAAQVMVHYLEWPILIGQVSMWCTAFLLGFSMGSIYPCVVQLPAELGMRVTGKMNGFFVLCAATGELTLPLAIAHLFDLLSPQVLPLVIIVAFVVASAVFVAIMRESGLPPNEWIILQANTRKSH